MGLQVTTDANGVAVGNVGVGITGYYRVNDDPDQFSGYADNGPQYSIYSDTNGDFSFWVPRYDNYNVVIIYGVMDDGKSFGAKLNMLKHFKETGDSDKVKKINIQ